MANASNMSLAELEAMLKDQKKRLEELKKKQAALQKDLDGVTQEIAVLEGKGKGSGRRGRPAGSTSTGKKTVRRRRAKNAKPLKGYVRDALAGSKKGLTLQEVLDSVKKAGYKSKSKNFKNVLYQCLYHTKEFVLDSKKGTYSVK
jgi:septal ring factor EnvC (AmiA/AmiB activator)